ncbi:hypothetical protein MKW98_011169 [Papaver atlanticum]|uniref:Uncharacterized protein n=1 Tax=Papaver atlanticum TaxID=357466 RepID=A0AAD4XYA6_9MAGN|nr:hypothetical protein MKW98_011169 [Papaver atlanticum]
MRRNIETRRYISDSPLKREGGLLLSCPSIAPLLIWRSIYSVLISNHKNFSSCHCSLDHTFTTGLIRQSKKEKAMLQMIDSGS